MDEVLNDFKWIIAFCPDREKFFCTKGSGFAWQHPKKFDTEEEAIQYFESSIDEFKEFSDALLTVRGKGKNPYVFLDNTKKRYYPNENL